MTSTNMKKERLLRGWKQSFIAEKTKLTTTAISDIENGKAKPSYRVLCILEDLFQMTHKELFRPLD